MGEMHTLIGELLRDGRVTVEEANELAAMDERTPPDAKILMDEAGVEYLTALARSVSKGRLSVFEALTDLSRRFGVSVDG